MKLNLEQIFCALLGLFAFLFGRVWAANFACSNDPEVFQSQSFCLPKNYSKQDRPNVDSDDLMTIHTGKQISNVMNII